MPTAIWARPAAPSNSMNKHCSLRARLGTAETKALRCVNLGNAYDDLGETRPRHPFYEQSLAICSRGWRSPGAKQMRYGI